MSLDVPRIRPSHPAPPRPRRWRPARHILVLAWRDLIRIAHTPEQLLDVTLQPIIFLVMFTYIFGGALGDGSRHSYLQFLLPGIMGQTIALGGVAIGVNLNIDVTTGIFDRFRSLPIRRSAPLIAAVLTDVVRYVTLCVFILGTGYAIGFRVHSSVPDVFAACALATGFALCMSWASVFIGMVSRSPGSVNGLMTVLILPLSFSANTFVKVATMPGWLQDFVRVNPLTHLVDAIRGLLLGGVHTSDIVWTLGWMGVLLAVFFPLAMRSYLRHT